MKYLVVIKSSECLSRVGLQSLDFSGWDLDAHLHHDTLDNSAIRKWRHIRSDGVTFSGGGGGW